MFLTRDCNLSYDCYFQLKGLSSTEAVQEAEKLLCQLNLTQKKDYLPGALSGGMKRKLNLAMALIGKSKVSFMHF